MAKRKHIDDDASETVELLVKQSLDIPHDSEVPGDDLSSDDGEIDVFPELDSSSDEDPDSDDIEGLSQDEQEDDEESESESELEPTAGQNGTMIVSSITGEPKRVYPEIEPDYDSDSSTEEDPNRVGNVPMHWYDDLPHIGYDINGKKVLRPARGDELDKFLATVEDPNTWTSAFDENAQMDKPLTEEELDIIRRLHDHENPDATYDPFEPTVEWFTAKGKEEIMPLSSAPEPKRRWVPSKWEKKKVMKIVRAIREGRIVPNKPESTSPQKQVYALWSEQSTSLAPPPLTAPKRPLPTNSESYNPPEEYLPSEEERKEWESLDPEDRPRDYLPQKYLALRLVPAYNNFVKERFNRQLDLYMAPRVHRVKLNIDPQSLIPKLPSPSSLRPFPCYRSLEIHNEYGRVRCLSVSPDGLWAASGAESGIVSLWEVNVGNEIMRWELGSRIGSVEWCPRQDVCFILVGIEEAVHFFIPPNLPSAILEATTSLLAPIPLPPPPAVAPPVKWESSSEPKASHSSFLTLRLPSSSGLVSQVAWHRKGDYVATTSTGGLSSGVWIHQMSKRNSQAPFKKIRGAVQAVLFHPLKPHLFVATQQYVRLYNLVEQKLIKTFIPGIKWISSMDVHPSGDHLIVGGYDRKLCWFDLELSDKPYKVLRYHSRAIRSLQFHPTYPLFASSSDDGSIQIFHGRVYNDLMTDPLIVPLKILRGHEVRDGLGVLQIRWCNRYPWLVSGGADGTVAVWCS